MISVVIFILILGFLVLIHEFGHFIVAKKSGVRVEEFGFGFPPRLWGKKIGDTIYSVNAIPLGGFVKLFGEEYNELPQSPKSPKSPLPAEALRIGGAKVGQYSHAFVYKKPWIKTLIILAGVIMNAALGITIYYSLLTVNHFQSEPLPLLRPYHFRFGTQEGRVIATNITKGSPAEKAGIKVEDIVQRYRIGLSPWTQITTSSELINFIKSSPGIPVTLDLENVKNGSKKVVSLVPVYNVKLKRAIIGVNLLDTVVLKYETPKQKLFSGFMHSYNILAYNYSTIGELFKVAVKEKSLEPVSHTVSGPIGIYSIVNEIVKTSGEKLIKNVLNIMALLSLSLAAMNVLPLPALDGGRLVFIIFEWITGRPIHKKIEQYINLGGFVLLIALGILVSINDVMRLFK
ncbi:MAG: M50 family metallopeptidase [Patescibacteria group bacterium]